MTRFPAEIRRFEIGWLAWLTFGGELFDQFTTMEDAQAAVEAALDHGLT